MPSEPSKAGKLTESQYRAIRNTLANAYRDRGDYPPYATAPWDDRVRYHAYILKLLEELVGS